MKKPKAPKVKSPAVNKSLPAGVHIIERPKGPPPIVKKGPPPPAPFLQRPGTQPQFSEVVAAERAAQPKIEHRPILQGATHLEFTSEPNKSGQVTVVVAPIKAFGDFSSLKGTIRYGKLVGTDTFRYAPGEAPAKQDTEQDEKVVAFPARKGPPPPPGSAPAKPARTPSAGGKREGVCGFIDDTIEAADGEQTAEEILAIVLAKFPGRDAAATMSTIRARPSHMRKAGKTPKPFRK